MRGARLRALALAGLGLALGACAAAPPPAPVAAPAPPVPVAVKPAEPAPPPPAAAPPPPTPLELLVAARRDKALAFEQEGRLRRALDEWKIALAVDPTDAAAQDGRKKLEARIEQSVATRLRQGREAVAKGDHVEARRHYLVVLALDPANQAAFTALQTEVKELRFVNHTVRAGETLATLADRYYGDRSRSEVIWEVNQLPPSPRLAPGTVLRIPEIPGVPFVTPELRARAPAASSTPEAGPRPEAAPASPSDAGRVETQAPAQMNPLLVEAKEALDKGDYQVALADVDKVLAGNARDTDGLDLKKAALYGLGKSQLGLRKYDESYRTLTQLTRLAPSYQDTGTLLQQARERLIQQHYSQGLRLFQEEKLSDAIGQWRTVLEYDPQHANAKKNIEQAESLLRRLQQRQQPRPAPGQPAPQPPKQ